MSHDFTRRAFLSAASGAGAVAFGVGATGAEQSPTYSLALTRDGWVGRSPSEIRGQNAPTLNLDPGQRVTVEWTNRTNEIHNFVVTKRYPGGNALFRSDYVASGDSQTVTFQAQEGLAAYYCENHLEEKGDIVVGQGQATATQTATVEDRNLTQAASQPVQTFRFAGSTTGWQALAPSSIAGQTNPTLRLVPGRLYGVEWINADGAPHNWEMENDQDETLVRSDVIARSGARQTVRFVATEDMSVYYCQYHPIGMRGQVQTVSEEEVTQRTTAQGRKTTAANRTGAQPTTDSEFQHATVARDIGQENATRTTTAGNRTTTPGNGTAGGNNRGDRANGGVDAEDVVQTARAPGFGPLAALGGIAGAAGYLLSGADDDEE
ncbi:MULTISPECIES: cupredoxin domain-containing protein [Halorussus]|uniref:cupredoxin domain-containing protein n=1 Tax=Halorussus TaxID=1070314 RepID=UPI0020A17B79|nr:plastocyanin/azurin family copper-binding protein [Halorussus vallis]USZ77507.1 plastocyanin/azurin family copper-binding protein [Halorussus vallis]